MKVKSKLPSRWQMFFDSTILNFAITGASISIVLWNSDPDSSLASPLAAAMFLLIFIGYALWFLIKKPATIPVDSWLSSMSGLFTLYMLITTALKEQSPWWGIFALLSGIALLFIYLLRTS